MSDYEVFYSADGSTVVDIDDIQTNSAGSVEAYYSPNGVDLFQFWPREVVIDDFEAYGGSLSLSDRYTLTGAGSSSVTGSAAIAPGSTQGLRLHEFQNIWSMVGEGLENYPQDGVPFEWWFRPQSSGSGDQYHVLFAHQSSSAAADRYQVEIHRSGGARISIRQGGSRQVIATSGSDPSWSNVTYRARVVADSSSGISFQVFTSGGGQIVDLSSGNTTWVANEMSIGWWNSANATVHYDGAMLVPG